MIPDDRRIKENTAGVYRNELGKEAEGMYIKGVMFYNRQMQKGKNGTRLAQLSDHLDRMEGLAGTGRATKEMLLNTLKSLKVKMHAIEEGL